MYKKFLTILTLLVLLAVTFPAQAQGSILAFPGAEGFGANTVGGRGGAIYEVTNLSDSGTGSLRACVIASGARTCVFKVGGLITLSSPLTITNPYITIAGQTAPGGGITLRKSSGGDVFTTQTHDVIIRYITARTGAGGENHVNQVAKNGVELYNIIIDHNSMSWGVDSNLDIWYRVRDFTVQWSIISEALDCSTHSKGCHSKGLLAGGYKGSESGGKGSENMSILNNLFAHNGERNPLLKICGIGQVVNNTTYNPYWTFAHQQLSCPLGESYVNWVNNYHKRGLDSTSVTDLKIIPDDSGTCYSGKTYMSGNYGAGSGGAWSYGINGSCAGKPIIVTVPAVAPNVATTNATQAKDAVLANSGNNAGIACDGTWYARRDSIDTRVVNDVKNGTGRIIDSPSEVGGWITPAAGVGCADGDKDGMPNEWEAIYGFDANVKDNNGDKDGDGYTNVEEFFNGTNPTNGTPPTLTPTPIIVVTTVTINTPTRTPTPTVTPTRTPTNTPTSTRTSTPTLTATSTPTVTPTPVVTATPTCLEDAKIKICYWIK